VPDRCCAGHKRTAAQSGHSLEEASFYSELSQKRVEIGARVPCCDRNWISRLRTYGMIE
jgi:hypothetical protein